MFWIMRKKNKEYLLKFMKNRAAGKKEFKIMESLKHENVVRVISSQLFNFKNVEYFGIFMEFYLRGDLEEFLNRKKSDEGNWSENDALKFSSQLIYGLSYLHENQIVHRDIKPKNIFLTESDQLKIGDFDVSEHISTTRKTTKVGTELYMPPESLDNHGEENLSHKIDIWACGCVLYYIAYLEHPFLEKSRFKTSARIYEVDAKEPTTIFPKCQSLIEICLKKEPGERVENAMILSEHRDIRNLICQLEAKIEPNNLSFSNSYEDCVRLANKKLKRDKELLEEILNHHEDLRNLEIEYSVKKVFDFIGKKTKKTVEDFNKAYPRNFLIKSRLQGIGYYFGADDRNVRFSNEYKEKFKLSFIFDAVDRGIRHINLKFCFDKSIDIRHGDWEIKSPKLIEFDPPVDGKDWSDWKLSIKNNRKQLKFEAFAENICYDTGVVSSRVENIQSKTVDGAEVVETPAIGYLGYLRWNIALLMS
ncbi:Oidioi.mRNA.OKI2018_I69.chr1.g84.t1.cds [Oikopleura dioica]|uniref:Oidioi.mRNA.OKI2018_I69.chr1.g84.t1.cds n=1 Tax=Oikopleura dioica TaxID=34765 RepID=A0ABN7SMI5_OIKDI|nr:Oidioi.mRNA.OKI2018_I69.chr1.g84.t1.cds [Oikopleura dioica]